MKKKIKSISLEELVIYAEVKIKSFIFNARIWGRSVGTKCRNEGPAIACNCEP
jgi:hypothetical protein